MQPAPDPQSRFLLARRAASAAAVSARLSATAKEASAIAAAALVQSTRAASAPRPPAASNTIAAPHTAASNAVAAAAAARAHAAAKRAAGTAAVAAMAASGAAARAHAAASARLGPVAQPTVATATADGAATGGGRGPYRHYLAVFCMFRDEAGWLREWIEFHRLVGVEHFYLYDNGSTDATPAVLAPYVAAGVATVTPWPHPFASTVVDAFNHALGAARGRSRWLAMLDSDEFLMPVVDADLPTLLRRYEAFGGLCVHWRMFGTGGVERVPADRLMIETLTRRAPHDWGENRHVKTVVQPDRALYMFGQHVAHYAPGYHAVDERARPVTEPITEDATGDLVRLHHYFTRDGRFLREVKLQRRARFMGDSPARLVALDATTYSLVEDHSMRRFVPALRRRVFGEPSADSTSPLRTA